MYENLLPAKNAFLDIQLWIYGLKDFQVLKSAFTQQMLKKIDVTMLGDNWQCMNKNNEYGMYFYW